MKTVHSKWTLTESFWGWVKGAETNQQDATSQDELEKVRQRILMALLRAGVSGNSSLVDRVIKAPELLDLWYLRSDVMRTLAQQQDEAFATRIITEISRFFEGLLPAGLANACFFSPHSLARGKAASLQTITVCRESIAQMAMRLSTAPSQGHQAG